MKEVKSVLIPILALNGLMIVVVFFRVLAATSGGVQVMLNVENPPLPSSAPVIPGPFMREGVADAISPSISRPVIRVSDFSARVSWETDEVALCQLSLRLEGTGKEGFFEVDFRQSHSVLFYNLSPLTVYHFQIQCSDRSGNGSQTKDIEFTTLSLGEEDIVPPANVSYFEAIAGDEQVRLRWLNPPDPDFKGLVIVRNSLFYPQDLLDGKIIYDGFGFSMVDVGVSNNQIYYYTAFSYDRSDNFSSGAVAKATPLRTLGLEFSPSPIFRTKDIALEDFEFWQWGERLALASNRKLSVKSGSLFRVTLTNEKALEDTKAILVELRNSGESISFLLRMNEGKTLYEGEIISPFWPGEGNILIKIFDYENQEQKELSGRLIFEKKQEAGMGKIFLLDTKVKEFIQQNKNKVVFGFLRTVVVALLKLFKLAY